MSVNGKSEVSSMTSHLDEKLGKDRRVLNDYPSLVGKTIAHVSRLGSGKTDDEGFLLLDFSDNTSALVVCYHLPDYTGKSENEYPTGLDVHIIDN